MWRHGRAAASELNQFNIADLAGVDSAFELGIVTVEPQVADMADVTQT